MGVFPVPPTARFPIEITGIEKETDGFTFKSKSKLRSRVTASNKIEKGKRRYRSQVMLNIKRQK